MILVDTSVWIDYFRGLRSPVTDELDRLLGADDVLMGDIILTELLQGFTDDRAFRLAQTRLDALTMIEIGGRDIAVEAAQNYRRLRGFGVTVRKTIDTLIATRCLVSGHSLLYSDRDFDPFVEHLGLQTANP
ncbi:type II toxin-antitoxin system VapC family toxin [Phenylobacterium sp.]|uniref:type II toxin-antitoxin system VapC family toxin n=1 Tax=Phenylobacterium sp. TaxID=1871053 RepID=UPI003D2D57D7